MIIPFLDLGPLPIYWANGSGHVPGQAVLNVEERQKPATYRRPVTRDRFSSELPG
jgi:hypothetical protein